MPAGSMRVCVWGRGGGKGGLRATQGLISKSLVLHREEDAISLLVLLLMYLHLSSSLSQSLYRLSIVAFHLSRCKNSR